jgi:hypothetical protein
MNPSSNAQTADEIASFENYGSESQTKQQANELQINFKKNKQS